MHLFRLRISFFYIGGIALCLCVGEVRREEGEEGGREEGRKGKGKERRGRAV